MVIDVWAKAQKKIGFGWADRVIRQAGSRADVAPQWGESHSKVEFIFLYVCMYLTYSRVWNRHSPWKICQKE